MGPDAGPALAEAWEWTVMRLGVASGASSALLDACMDHEP